MERISQAQLAPQIGDMHAVVRLVALRTRVADEVAQNIAESNARRDEQIGRNLMALRAKLVATIGECPHCGRIIPEGVAH